MDFISNFLDQALKPEHGHSLKDIAELEAAIGQPLPEALSEWYRLVGHRLQETDSAPILLKDLLDVGSSKPDKDAKLPVYAGAGGHWGACIELQTEDEDPLLTTYAGDEQLWTVDHLSEFLTAMMIHETTTNPLNDSPLGELKDSVIIGHQLEYFHDPMPEAYPCLYRFVPQDESINPHCLFGHSQCFLVLDPELNLYWICADDSAKQDLGREIELEEDNEHILFLEIETAGADRAADMEALLNALYQVSTYTIATPQVAASTHSEGGRRHFRIRLANPTGHYQELEKLIAESPLKAHIRVRVRPDNRWPARLIFPVSE